MIGGRVGGIRHQIEDGVSGFLVAGGSGSAARAAAQRPEAAAFSRRAGERDRPRAFPDDTAPGRLAGRYRLI